jgi:hypothetical protein
MKEILNVVKFDPKSASLLSELLGTKIIKLTYETFMDESDGFNVYAVIPDTILAFENNPILVHKGEYSIPAIKVIKETQENFVKYHIRSKNQEHIRNIGEGLTVNKIEVVHCRTQAINHEYQLKFIDDQENGICIHFDNGETFVLAATDIDGSVFDVYLSKQSFIDDFNNMKINSELKLKIEFLLLETILERKRESFS